jgi:MFS transporter, ACS family, D-galactonate transporter
VVGLVWCIVWLAMTREGPLAPDGLSSGALVARLSYRRLFRCRTVIGVQLVGFCANWLLTQAVVWLPAFLIRPSATPRSRLAGS